MHLFSHDAQSQNGEDNCYYTRETLKCYRKKISENGVNSTIQDDTLKKTQLFS